METILGLIGVVGYMIAVMAIAAGLTWLVVKLTPASKPAPTE